VPARTAAHADKVAAAVNGVRSVKDDLIVKKDVHE
jgi:osmotically-inducible protein OsmY